MPIFTPATVDVETESDPHPCGPATMLRFSDSGGLTQFGAFVETLPPGSRSSLRHWHAEEDEFIYMLSGEVIVHEGPDATVLHPGEAACFKAGVAAGHFLENHSDANATYLVVGTRANADVITYPDHDRVLHFSRETQKRDFTTLDGTPAEGSPYTLPDA